MVKKVLGAAAAAIVLFVWAPRAEASSITVAGSTLGCFGTGCSTYSLNPYSGAEYDITFNGVTSFSEVTNVAGTSPLFAVGSFGRGNGNLSTTSPDLDFAIEVTFTLPVGVGGSPTTFSTVIVGKNVGGGGPVVIDFDNSLQHFTYTNALGSGSFDFNLFNDPQVSKNTNLAPITLWAQIQNATFTPVTPNPNATVPEPGTLVLFGTGLTAVALRLRKSIRKS